MKKIITLALAAVLTLGLVTLPQAADKTSAQKYADQEAVVKELKEKYEAAKTTYGIKVAAEDVAKKAWDNALVEADTDPTVSAAKKAWETADAAQKDAKKKEYDGAFEKFVEPQRTAWEGAHAATVSAKAAMDKAEVAWKLAEKDLGNLDYAHVVLVDENKKVVAEGDVPAGHYTVEELLKYFGLDKDAYDFKYADDDNKLQSIRSIGGRYGKEVIELVKKYPVMVRAIDEEGREIGTYKANTSKLSRRGWVTAKEVAAEELTFEAKTQEALGVNGYWILADVEENEKPQYVNSWTKGGEKYITAVYTVAKRKVSDKKTGATKVTKPGQVGKTGEVATVATGLGALMTLAGVVLATKRH